MVYCYDCHKKLIFDCQITLDMLVILYNMFRPTFYYNDNNNDNNNNKTNPLRAGGCLFYKFDENNKMHVLLITNHGKYEDFGGKTDEVDKCIEDTIIREVMEESNCLIDECELKDQLIKNNCIYVKRSKYLLYIIEASEKQAKLTGEMFGNKELHDNLFRTVEWMLYEEMKSKKNIHVRLLSADIFNHLDTINNIKKIEKLTI